MKMDEDTKLCIPELNCVEWEDFRAAGRNKELFRKTEFYAIDVLIGEPMIKMAIDSKERRRRTRAPHSSANASGSMHAVDSEEAPLPERIRINSPGLIEVISDVTKDKLSGPFLMFRPFRSLVYYEQDLRNKAAEYEKLVEVHVEASAEETDEESREAEDGRGTMKDDSNETENDQDDTEEDLDDGEIDGKDQQRTKFALLQKLRCLISFIDNYIKKKQQYLASTRCKSVTFADLPFLYVPGDIVISNNYKQAARVIKVASTRHRVKDPDFEGNMDFWKDDTVAEFDDTPIFLFVNYIDFDGSSLGPVSGVITFSRSDFDGKDGGRKEITSLEVYPLRCSEHNGLRDELIKRGKMFLDVARIKPMHYSGLSVDTREEIDSQVVIDFEEAYENHPKWKVYFRRVADEAIHKLTDWDSDSSDDEDLTEAVKTHRRARGTSCVKECCKDETVHNDEHLDNRIMEDFITEQMDGTAPLCLATKTLKDIGEHTVVADDDFVIMAFRALGFALRSRKRHQMELAHMSEIPVLGKGEGLDQLVLPSGHVDMVKSMIRQHFRDKKLATAHNEKLDVVRGKGRGLIILLHGVPGVGKTSTAECVADSFRRPLFQITSGDLGTTAEEVEEALEENFNLASRWGSILLIDEADVFLGERTREDFVRNSLVAVFLRMMEYYTGVLFLTTNRVGVFDEAFTSRIHISLYYPPLERDATRQIFQKNWEMIQSRYEKNNRKLEINQPEITQFAMDYFDANKDGRWNGRQIRNAFQSALALAELDALGTDDLLDESDHGRTVVLGKKNFETVAHAYRSFLNYLKQVYGADSARRARENMWRFDAYGMPKMPNALTTRLKVAEPGPPTMTPPRAPPGAQPWTPAGPPPSQAGYGYREPQPSTYYPPQPPPPAQQPYYPERYDYQDQRPRHMPAPDSYAQPPPPQDRYTDAYARGPERYATGPERLPQTPEQQFRRSAPRESGFPGREEDDPR
ncbi:hypothetical protein PG984_000165 [Apiospora sp. TS-2023a]